MQTPTFPLITLGDIDAVEFAMSKLSLLVDGESIQRIERAGEGNMNLVLRVVTDQKSIVLKQSRPYVEKYPQIEAPVDRIHAEIDFYRRVAVHQDICRTMPRLLASDAELHLMAMQDLGKSSDYSDLYQATSDATMPLEEATGWLARLHSIRVSKDECTNVGNRALRELNHAHIFAIPMQNPSAIGLDEICDGLEDLAQDIRASASLRKAAAELGERYLADGDTLLHGDFYPGSWLRTDRGFRVIDPEFTFAGPAEFDLAVLAAHCLMIGLGERAIEDVCRSYQQFGGSQTDQSLVRRFAGMEVIRRLIGVAQLPLNASLAQRSEWMEMAKSLLAT